MITLKGKDKENKTKFTMADKPRNEKDVGTVRGSRLGRRKKKGDGKRQTSLRSLDGMVSIDSGRECSKKTLFKRKPKGANSKTGRELKQTRKSVSSQLGVGVGLGILSGNGCVLPREFQSYINTGRKRKLVVCSCLTCTEINSEEGFLNKI